MQIRTDKEGGKVIQQLCDVALKQGGMNNLNSVVSILNSVNVDPELEKLSKKSPKQGSAEETKEGQGEKPKKRK